MSTFRNCQKRVMLQREKSDFVPPKVGPFCVSYLQGLRRNCSDDLSEMADKAKKKARGNYCVAGGPNMTNCESN